ncbi:MAG: hypothetical protein Q9225_003486 [Loekoesia sp. 1 TL-2023]
MSNYEGQKRKRATVEVEQNKRRRLSPDTRRGAHQDEYPFQQPTQIPQPSANVHTPTQPPLEGTNDGLDEIEQLELEAARVQHRLAEARRRAAQRSQQSQGSGVAPAPPRNVSAEAPSSIHRPDPSRVRGSSYAVGSTPSSGDGRPPRPAPPPVNLSTKPKLAGFRTPSKTGQGSQPPVSNVNPSQPTLSPYDAPPPSPLRPRHGFYPTAPSTGKRDRDEWADSYEDGTANDERATHRRKLDKNQPVTAGQPPTYTSNPDQLPGDQLPSSDGLDLLGLHPPTPPSSHPKQTGGHPVFPGNTIDPFSLLNEIEVPGGSIAASNGSSAPNLWDWPYDPVPNVPTQTPQQTSAANNGLSEAQIAALVEAANRQFGNRATAGIPSQPTNPYQPIQYPTVQHLGKHSRNEPENPEAGRKQQNPAVGEPQTKRQKRLQSFGEKGIELGTDNKKKGEVRYVENGEMLGQVNGKWVPAAYHNDRRGVLLERADRMGRYRYSSDHGGEDHDRMAYHPSYADFNMRTREGRPDILYQWKPENKKPAAQDPGFMIDEADGKVLLDINNHPIRNWPELPLTISGQVEGLWLEFWRRLNPAISLPDIVARCPEFTTVRTGLKEHKLSIAAYSNRMRRDRVSVGTRAWDEREGSKEIAERLKAIMPNRVLAQIERENSTGSWRDLTSDEVDAVLNVNKGKGSAPARAGSKKLPDPVKQVRDGIANEKTSQTLRRLQDEKQAEDLAWEEGYPDFENPTSTDGDQMLGAVARDSPSAGGEIEEPAQDPLEETGEPSPKDHLGETSLDLPESVEGSTLVEPPLEEGQTTLVEEADPSQIIVKSEGFESPGEEDDGDEIGTPNPGNDTPDIPAEEPIDYALQVPDTMDEVDIVQYALEVTRAEYQELTGREPPDPSNIFQQSYNQQWTELQESLNNYWFQCRPGRIPPILPKRSGWIGSWDAWEDALVTETSFDNPSVAADADANDAQVSIAENPELARLLAINFGENVAESHDSTKSEAGNAAEAEKLPELDDDQGVETTSGFPGSIQDGDGGDGDGDQATADGDVPPATATDYENDFDRLIRESQDTTLQFGDFEGETNELTGLDDFLREFADTAAPTIATTDKAVSPPVENGESQEQAATGADTITQLSTTDPITNPQPPASAQDPNYDLAPIHSDRHIPDSLSENGIGSHD